MQRRAPGGALALLRVGSNIAVGQVNLTDAKRATVGVAIVTYMFLDGGWKA